VNVCRTQRGLSKNKHVKGGVSTDFSSPFLAYIDRFRRVNDVFGFIFKFKFRRN
jgi:hypothetical protein